MELNALQLAYDVYTASQKTDDPASMDLYVIPLAETGVFSNNNIVSITGLTRYRVDQIFSKSKKDRGGRFNPETLVLLVDFQAGPTPELARSIVNLGTSTGMMSRLTGVSDSRIKRWLA